MCNFNFTHASTQTNQVQYIIMPIKTSTRIIDDLAPPLAVFEGATAAVGRTKT